MIKNLTRVFIQDIYFNIIKAIYDKPIVNIILKGGKPKSSLLNSGTRQGSPLSHLFTST